MNGQYIYKLIGLLVIISFAACSELANHSLSPNTFVFSLHQNPGQLIDVRSINEWQKEHLPGSIHLATEDLDAFKRSINRLNRREFYYVYCQNGNSSKTALKLMRDAGFHNVYHLQGGLQSLEQEGYTIAGF